MKRSRVELILITEDGGKLSKTAKISSRHQMLILRSIFSRFFIIGEMHCRVCCMIKQWILVGLVMHGVYHMDFSLDVNVFGYN